MRSRLLLLALALAASVVLAGRPGFAKEPKSNAEEEGALQKSAEAFVEAFHKGDAKAVAAFWTPEGDYTDLRGRHFKGRDTIEKVFSELFAENKGLKLRINIESLRFPLPNVAVEDGVTEVAPEHGPPSRARYTIMHVKQDGQWLIDNVREAMYIPPTNYEQLRNLEWAIGDWVAEAKTGEGAHLSFAWAPHQNFIINTFSTTFGGMTLGEGTQWIGWDPVAKTIRAWTFETAGGFGEATWTREGDKWVSKLTAVRRDGSKLTATNTVTRLDPDTLGFESTERTINDKPAPDIKGIKLKRAK
jgi:uncharacterized protein (TIGR02246 family)